MKKLLVIGIFIFLLTGCGKTKHVDKMKIEDIELNDFDVINEYSLTEFDEIFGQPLEQLTEELYEDFYVKYNEYDNMEIGFSLDNSQEKGKIVYFEIYDDSISPINGIKVGDTVEDVICKFSIEENPIEYEDSEQSDVKLLYGEFGPRNSGDVYEISAYINYLNRIETKITYYLGICFIEFILDEEQKVETIIFNEIL